VREIAQTNLQLYDELLTRQWPADDLAVVRGAYELAAELFSGQYRCSGKPFVAHLVGTASAVAATDGRRDLVLAALLHAAYTDGDFGNGRGSSDQQARSRVRSVVGRGAETLVVAYGQTPWNAAALAAAHADVDRLDATQRDVVILQIANEADEHADLGVRVCDKGGLDLYRESSLAMMCDLADRLDRPALAALLRSLSTEEREATVPVVLRSSGLASHLLPPASYRLRPRLVLRRALGRARSLASRRLRVRTARRTR
jgi:(p)ppGpp synthase/HD superfamily hydrolase